MFQLKRRPADAKKTKHKKIRAVSAEDVRYAWSFGQVMNNLLLDQTNFYWTFHMPDRP
jgi:hypothetical protein